MTTLFWILDVWLDLFDLIAVSGGLHSHIGWGNFSPCSRQCGLCNVQAMRLGRGIDIHYTLETSGGKHLICVFFVMRVIKDSAADNSLDQFLWLVWTCLPHVGE